MLHPNSFKFLAQLKTHNNKIWFDKHRDEYEEIRAGLISFVDELIKEISKFDKNLSTLAPKSCIFRINRDVRFSKDKSPYKSNLAASFTDGGKKSPKAGYYFHIMPGDCFLGGGIWHPEPDALKKVRQEIDYNAKDFIKIINKPSFKKIFGKLDEGDKMVNAPKEYSKDNPNLDLLKFKSYVFSASLTEADFLSMNGPKKVAAIFKELSPFINFLNQAI